MDKRWLHRYAMKTILPGEFLSFRLFAHADFAAGGDDFTWLDGNDGLDGFAPAGRIDDDGFDRIVAAFQTGLKAVLGGCSLVFIVPGFDRDGATNACDRPNLEGDLHCAVWRWLALIGKDDFVLGRSPGWSGGRLAGSGRLIQSRVGW
jgi:hypothetical protein